MASMANPARRFCVCCGGPTERVGPISTRGYCARCGDGVMLANVEQLRAKAGPFAEAWQRRTAEGVARAIARSSDAAGEAA